MNQTLVSSKYQVVIPKEIRRKIKVKPGQKLDVDVMGEKIVLSPAKQAKELKWPHDYIKLLKLENLLRGEPNKSLTRVHILLTIVIDVS